MRPGIEVSSLDLEQFPRGEMPLTVPSSLCMRTAQIKGDA